MPIKSLALAGLLSLAAVPAFADTVLTASLAQPVSKETKVIASDTLWDCQGATCTTQVSDYRAQSVSLCRDLTKEVGAVSTYSAAGSSFAAEQLAKCNAGRSGQASAQAR
jgi:hypothetical protein